jgi:hypothetical protein
VRFATEDYDPKAVHGVGKPPSPKHLKPGQEPPVDPALYMHLTNYAINKESENFKANEADFKKTLREGLDMIAAQESENDPNIVQKLWAQFKDIIVKTLLMSQPHLEHNYKTCASKSHAQNNRQCFQILGYDIMLDSKLKPWLLEVNESPSFNDDTETDRIVKQGLIEDTFRLLDVKKSAKYRILGKDKQRGVVHRNAMAVGKMDLGERAEIEAREEQQMVDAQRKFERYQLKNLGGFEKLWPFPQPKRSSMTVDSTNEDGEEFKTAPADVLTRRATLYEEIRQLASQQFNSQFGMSASWRPSYNSPATVAQMAKTQQSPGKVAPVEESKQSELPDADTKPRFLNTSQQQNMFPTAAQKARTESQVDTVLAQSVRHQEVARGGCLSNSIGSLTATAQAPTHHVGLANNESTDPQKRMFGLQTF